MSSCHCGLLLLAVASLASAVAAAVLWVEGVKATAGFNGLVWTGQVGSKLPNGLNVEQWVTLLNKNFV